MIAKQKRSSFNQASEFFAKSFNWFFEHDIFVHFLTKTDEDAKSIQQLFKTKSLTLNEKTNEMWISKKMNESEQLKLKKSDSESI